MELTPQQWENVKALFEIALEKTPSDRNSFLDKAAQDSMVRNEVERLLAHHVESGRFLSRPALPSTASSDNSSKLPFFFAGDLLVDRFRITRFLARGGMGEVYEAEDVELRERVALKSIRSDLLNDGRALDRFKREVHLARKVTHPNVCRIFDLFRQPSIVVAGQSRGPMVFVAMELLEGETLAEYLKRQPRMRVEQARPIALQIASGLGAAHAAGILHRDFKPGNVLLVPGPKGMRAVITDFGLALRSNQDVSLSTVTVTGELLGTPAYMSPEQVESKELTPASDVYSLGLVLYQMVTGTRAFEDTTPLSMAVKRVKEDPVPPRTLVPDLNRHWEAVILRCLERDPKKRYQNGEELAEALRGSASAQDRTWSLDKRMVLATLALLLVIAASVVLIPRIRNRVASNLNSTASMQPIAVRPSVAVLPFHNLSGRSDTEWVSTALPEMLTAELAAGEKLRTFPGENIARASADLGLTSKQTLARDTLGRLRKYLGSDYVVLGSYLDQAMLPKVRFALTCGCRMRRPPRSLRPSRRRAATANSTIWPPGPALICAENWASVKFPLARQRWCVHRCRRIRRLIATIPRAWRNSVSWMKSRPASSYRKQSLPIPSTPSGTPHWRMPGRQWVTTRKRVKSQRKHVSFLLVSRTRSDSGSRDATGS